jgi:hypothetical protein
MDWLNTAGFICPSSFFFNVIRIDGMEDALDILDGLWRQV